MKRAFKRPQTIVYRACRIVAMRLTYTSAQDFPTVLPVRVSRRPLTEFTPLVPYCWNWAGQGGSRRGEELEGGSSSVGRRRNRFARERSDRIRICREGFVAFRGCREGAPSSWSVRRLGGQVCNDSRQVSATYFGRN